MIFDGTKLQALRQSQQLTQGDVASVVGVNDYNVISRWELGKTEPKSKHLLRLCAVLGCDVRDLMKGD